MKKQKVGIAIYDLHFPEHDKQLWKNILKLAKDLKPDYFVFGGDNMDMKELSHWVHAKGDMRTLEGRRIKAEYTQFQEGVLDPLCAILKKPCEKHFLLGNHEDWAEQAIDRNPQGEGYWEVENNLKLKDWTVYPLNRVCSIGKMHFIHGTYTNDAHAKKHVTNYESNIFYGHVHDHQIYTKVTPLNNEAHIGMSIPCACTLNPDYMRNKPNKWVNGLLVFTVFPDGNFTAHPIISNKGKFEYSGKVYE
jgi:predicted MPP superfamily phosphohydrolase